ncbi:MAG: pyridoxal-phosphate dependent enzyme, partial [Boseongicola sp. SB0670_bin_30]|nr:pyridoxal-phosphate dependent enzyme [Boseongicola sp. SB0670_bin_30]
DAPALKIANTRAYGAEVVLYDRATEDRDAIGTKLADERGLALVKPFDNEDVIAGQGTCGLEIAEQASEAGIGEADVLVPCGGGGLSSGIALALEALAPRLRVRPVEPEGFDDVARSLIAGTPRTNARMAGSICDAIVTPAPGQLTFPILQRLCGPGIAVPDEDALRAVAAAFVRLGTVLEPGGAVALAAALYHGEDERDVIVVASGGNVDPTVFRNALDRLGKTD